VNYISFVERFGVFGDIRCSLRVDRAYLALELECFLIPNLLWSLIFSATTSGGNDMRSTWIDDESSARWLVVGDWYEVAMSKG
jgi:hypothetical protein